MLHISARKTQHCPKTTVMRRSARDGVTEGPGVTCNVTFHWQDEGKMASSNNPRKFSEKIALHNQKQAEETAAFEEVMKDLNVTRAARVRPTLPGCLYVVASL